MNYKIVNVKRHYEVYVNDQFYCSADTYKEAEEEIEELINN